MARRTLLTDSRDDVLAGGGEKPKSSAAVAGVAVQHPDIWPLKTVITRHRIGIRINEAYHYIRWAYTKKMDMVYTFAIKMC